MVLFCEDYQEVGSLQLFRARGFWHGSTDQGFDCAATICCISEGLGPPLVSPDSQ